MGLATTDTQIRYPRKPSGFQRKRKRFHHVFLKKKKKKSVIAQEISVLFNAG